MLSGRQTFKNIYCGTYVSNRPYGNPVRRPSVRRSREQKERHPPKRLQRTRSTFSKSVMVSIDVSTLENTELIFIKPNAEVNDAYPPHAVRTFCHLLFHSWGNSHIQQENTPAHRVRDSGVFVSTCMAFIPPWLWKHPTAQTVTCSTTKSGTRCRDEPRIRSNSVDHLNCVLSKSGITSTS